MATKASSSLSPCIRLMEESLLLPTQNVGLFAKTFLLIFAHTFVFIAVAVHFAHPLATSILADIDIKAHNITTSSHHSKELLSLLSIYLSYLASKLATQLVTALATATTHSGERLTRKAATERITGGLLGTAVLAGVLELLLTALLAVPLVSTWTYADSGVKSLCGYTMFSVAFVLYIYLGTVITVSVGVSAADGGGCHHGVSALRRAWRLMGATPARRKEAAVLVFVVSLLPAFIYPAPVYAFSSVYPRAADAYSSLYYGVELASRFFLSMTRRYGARACG